MKPPPPGARRRLSGWRRLLIRWLGGEAPASDPAVAMRAAVQQVLASRLDHATLISARKGRAFWVRNAFPSEMWGGRELSVSLVFQVTDEPPAPPRTR